MKTPLEQSLLGHPSRTERHLVHNRLRSLPKRGHATEDAAGGCTCGIFPQPHSQHLRNITLASRTARVREPRWASSAQFQGHLQCETISNQYSPVFLHISGIRVRCRWDHTRQHRKPRNSGLHAALSSIFHDERAASRIICSVSS